MEEEVMRNLVNVSTEAHLFYEWKRNEYKHVHCIKAEGKRKKDVFWKTGKLSVPAAMYSATVCVTYNEQSERITKS